MGLHSAQDWIAWAGVVIPLASLAWAAWFYVLTRKREVQHQEFRRVFDVMDQLGRGDGSIASKMTAAYELRKFPEYRDVIVRFCEQAQVTGPSAKMLLDELKLTADYMKAR